MKNEKTGEDLVSIGFVIDLEYADATTSAHDLLQLFKIHPLVKGILEGGERVGWGAKALPGGGYWSMPKVAMPGAVLVGDAAGMVDTVALKGVHHCDQVGHPRRGGDLRVAQAAGARASTATSDAIEESSVGKELYEVRNTRQPFQKGFIQGGPLVNLMIATKGKFPGGRWSWHRNDAKPMFIGKTKDQLSQAGRQVHVRQAVVGLHHGQRDPRRRAEPHPRAEARPARDRRDVAVDVPRRACTRSPTTRPRAGRST